MVISLIDSFFFFFFYVGIEGWHRLAVRILAGGRGCRRSKESYRLVGLGRTSSANLDEFMRIHKGYMFTQALVAFVSYEDDAHIRWDLKRAVDSDSFFDRIKLLAPIFQLLINHLVLILLFIINYIRRRRRKGIFLTCSIVPSLKIHLQRN